MVPDEALFLSAPKRPAGNGKRDGFRREGVVMSRLAVAGFFPLDSNLV